MADCLGGGLNGALWWMAEDDKLIADQCGINVDELLFDDTICVCFDAHCWLETLASGREDADKGEFQFTRVGLRR